MINETSEGPQVPPPSGQESTEPVWTYRGYKLRSNDFTTAMVHLFRAEIARANVWRQRLDTTTNWAVVTSAAALSIAFGQEQVHYAVILLNILLVTLFWLTEARRYRYYEVWSTRVRLMETDFFAAMLVPPFAPDPDWAESLAENLLHPHFPISNWEALGRRLRRNYAYLFVIMGMAALGKLWIHPVPAQSAADILERAAFWFIPGWLFLLLGTLFYVFLFLVAFLTAGMHAASGEVLPRYAVSEESADEKIIAGEAAPRWSAWFRHGERRSQYLAFLITDLPEQVGRAVLNEMKRGVTELSGKGMYTGKQHSILMCALTITEISHFKAIVSSQDPEAFMIVTPAQEVLGKGFLPFQDVR
jgi:uncharacterized membrane protein